MNKNVFWHSRQLCEIISYIVCKFLLVHLPAEKKNTGRISISFLRKLSFILYAIWKLSCIHSGVGITYNDREKIILYPTKASNLRWIHCTNLIKASVADDVRYKELKEKITIEFDKLRCVNLKVLLVVCWC